MRFLFHLTFYGSCKYLEELLSRISTPFLEFTHMRFLRKPEPRFDVSQVSPFFCRMESQSLAYWAELGDYPERIFFSLAVFGLYRLSAAGRRTCDLRREGGAAHGRMRDAR